MKNQLKIKNKKYITVLILGVLILLTGLWFLGCSTDSSVNGEGTTETQTNDSLQEESQDAENPEDIVKETAGSDETGEEDDSASSDGEDVESDTTEETSDGTQTETEPADETCTIQINCKLLLDQDLAGTGLETLVPSNGIILPTTKVTLSPGDTVYDITLQITKQKKIHFSTQGSVAGGTLYVEAIQNIYEKAYNSKSGWIFLVNGEKPGISCGSYALKDGDVLVWAYTCDLGNDL